MCPVFWCFLRNEANTLAIPQREQRFPLLPSPGVGQTILVAILSRSQLQSMLMNTYVRLFSFCLSATVYCSSTAVAQGLIFYLPEDGRGVEYEGQITQTFVLNDGSTREIQKQRRLTIKSVGQENAEFNGAEVPCRWIEINVTTGDKGAGGFDTGPVGSRVYKVLVPESRVIAEAVDDSSIPNLVLPIIRGWRRNGESEVHAIKARALGIYPTICQLMNYPSPQVVSQGDTPATISNTPVSAKHMKGEIIMERRESRSTNQGEFWVSSEIPFGLVAWKVKVTQERKESTAARDKFSTVSTSTSEMSHVQDIEDAESELVTPED